MIAIFSDIHGNLEALKSIIKDIKNKNIKEIIFLGDAVSLGPNSNECLKVLIEENVKFILGNHEHYLIDTCEIDPYMEEEKKKHNKWIHTIIDKEVINKLRNFKNSYELIINNKRIRFLHFFLEKNQKYPYKSLNVFKNNKYLEIMESYDSDYTFYGHLHEGRYDCINNKHFYGIGSSGCVKNNKTFYYIIDTNLNVEKIIVEYDRNKFIEAINNSNYPSKSRISKSYFGI